MQCFLLLLFPACFVSDDDDRWNTPELSLRDTSFTFHILIQCLTDTSSFSVASLITSSGRLFSYFSPPLQTQYTLIPTPLSIYMDKY